MINWLAASGFFISNQVYQVCIYNTKGILLKYTDKQVVFFLEPTTVYLHSSRVNVEYAVRYLFKVLSKVMCWEVEPHDCVVSGDKGD